MEKKRKKINVKFLVLIISLVIFLSMSIFTFAYFTDSKSYTGNLTFGSLELDVSGGVSGDGVDTATSKLVFDVTRTSGPAYSTTKKVMPGDTININLTLGLKTGSEPAYYLISITDDNGVFDDAYYFSEDGTNVYVFDGEKTYLESDANKANVTTKYCGKITTSAKQTIKIGAKVSESYTEQNSVCNVICKVFAIQQANLEATNAKTELLGRIVGLDTSKYSYVNYIESDGNQYINSGYKPTSEVLKYKLSYALTTTGLDGYSMIGSANDADTNFGIELWGNRYYVGTGRRLLENSYTKNKRYNVCVEANNKLLTLNYGGVISSTSYTGSLYKNAEIGIFRTKTDSGWHSTSLGVGGSKIWVCKIYDNNKLVRNMIPCVRSSDNKPGMFDSVSNTFFTNAGSGEFLWG